MKRKLSVKNQLSGILACLVMLVWLSNCQLSYANSGTNSGANSGTNSGAASVVSIGATIHGPSLSEMWIKKGTDKKGTPSRISHLKSVPISTLPLSPGANANESGGGQGKGRSKGTGTEAHRHIGTEEKSFSPLCLCAYSWAQPPPLPLSLIGASGDDSARASGKITILLKERAEAGGEMILLGEIALFQGADEALAGELGQITLGKSPQPGYTVTITSQSILYQLKNHNNHRNAIDHPHPASPLKGEGMMREIDPANISFSGPDRCLVARQYREVTAEEVETIFRQRFFEQFSETEFELEKVKVGLPRNVRVPDGNTEYEVPFQDPPIRQEENFIFKIKHDGEVVKQIWISARLRYHTTVSVATRDLGKGETITAEDLALKSVVLNHSRSSDPERIYDPAQIIGMVCRQPIRAGSTLTLKMVDQPLLVKRGAIIKMTVESKNFRIVSLGRAKSDGRRGESIPAENLTSATGAPSQGNVYGVVIGENQIRITF